jgi:hypothetical protein
MVDVKRLFGFREVVENRCIGVSLLPTILTYYFKQDVVIE